MLQGWRKFGPETPITSSPKAYFDGKFMRLCKKDDEWFLSLRVDGEKIYLPAFEVLGILFMDDLRKRK